MLSYLETLRTVYRTNDLVDPTILPENLSARELADLAAFFSLDTFSYNVMQPLVAMIRGYDPVFKSQIQRLLNLLAAVSNKETSAIEEFKAILAGIDTEIQTIKTNCISVKASLTKTRDELATSIQENNNKLAQLESTKAALNAKKSVLEKKIAEIKKQIDILTGLSFLFGWLIGILVLTLKPFNAELDKVMAELRNTEASIQQTNQEKIKTENLIKELNASYDENQRLINGCDSIHNHVDSLKSALDQINVDNYFLKARIDALQKSWADLLKIADAIKA